MVSKRSEPQTAVSGGVQFCGFTSFTTLVPAPWLWLILEANEENAFRLPLVRPAQSTDYFE